MTDETTLRPAVPHRPCRVLLLATYFPKPGNPLLGTWALDQAKALARAGAEISVISLTPWFPRWPGQRRGIQAYSTCPPEVTWGDILVHYPRWLCYPMAGFERIYQRNPEPWLKLAWAGCGRRVKRLVEAWRPDILFAHHTCVNGWVAERIGSELGIPYVCQDHATWEVADYCSLFPSYRRVYRRIADHAAMMLGVSARMTRDIQKAAPHAHAAVLHNGANLPADQAVVDSSRPRPPIIFSAGMLVGWKGFDILIRAWATVVARFPNARLRIAGDGVERQRLHALRETLGVASSVEFLGYLPQQQVHTEMSAARAFVLASWNETFAVAYFEAAAAATPVVWCTNAGNAEVFIHGTHGLGIEPQSVESTAAALEFMLARPAEAAAMGAAARQMVRTGFTWDAVAHRALELFSTVTVVR